jgi:hypothetical protein
LGYGNGASRALAPTDEQAGNEVARRMAFRLRQGSHNYVEDWISIHIQLGQWNAVGLDNQHYVSILHPSPDTAARRISPEALTRRQPW